MEWSLSIDNIFVFIIIFASFGVRERHYGRVLLIGILMAIMFRIIFILGVVLVDQFQWILLLFRLPLSSIPVTGCLPQGYDEEFEPHNSRV